MCVCVCVCLCVSVCVRWVGESERGGIVNIVRAFKYHYHSVYSSEHRGSFP